MVLHVMDYLKLEKKFEKEDTQRIEKRIEKRIGVWFIGCVPTRYVKTLWTYKGGKSEGLYSGQRVYDGTKERGYDENEKIRNLVETKKVVTYQMIELLW